MLILKLSGKQYIYLLMQIYHYEIFGMIFKNINFSFADFYLYFGTSE